MKLSKIVIAAAVVAAGASSLATSAMAQAKEQFFPLLSHRTGPTRRTVCHGPMANRTI